MTTATTTRELKVGDHVTKTGDIVYSVRRILGDGTKDPRTVKCLSLKSHRLFTYRESELCWVSDDGGLGGHVIDYWEKYGRHRQAKRDAERAESEMLKDLGKIETQLKQLVATEAMLEQLGVRLSRGRLEKDALVSVQCERGRGRTDWFINLDECLTVEDQLTYLSEAWCYLLPANETRWVTDTWRKYRDDPEIERFALRWIRRERRCECPD